MISPEAQAALDEVVARTDPDLVGVVLTGSAARGMETGRSDVDVYVVWSDLDGRSTSRSPAIDEIAVTLDDLEEVGAFGTEEWWSRWSFAYARVLRDLTGGRLEAAIEAQARVSPQEARSILTTGDRLDGFVNFAYRALKSDRDGRPLERRLDAAEGVSWLLDTVFVTEGRVRPYNKYLGWELREHPLNRSCWAADSLLPVVTGMLDGDPAAVRTAFSWVEAAARDWDAEHGGHDLGDLLDGWGAELDVLGGAPG